MSKIKILIVDDHLLIRSGVRSLLKDVQDIEIVAEAEGGNEAIKKEAEFHPDVVLMDISMPDISGIEAASIIKKNSPGTGVLVLTMYENEEYIFKALKNGATGILHKNVSKEELITAIKTVAAGKKYFGNSISQIMIQNYMQKFDEENSGDEKQKVILTRREKEVLKALAKGLSNIEIGEQLKISPRTVDTHKTNLLQKLNLKSTSALARFAYENGYNE